ncbi:hypothetical protein BDV26DRAFT_156031 [Aspergillus bertholletiae]|uniref:Zn(2)-C6 fungal-type domain-containing protein n=1 Tax=Aspergillus bertholletiae TaxID=1226010 RepID=A0A5N7BDD6_9EURO|nr:hypothetical protein BDV26DRAFT_156031 [Aspergillus bertholletiae]
MGNTGLPSKDCHLCRRRRVKCDLARPGCLRCKKIGNDCPGYRDLGRLGSNFRILTLDSYPRQKRKRCQNQNAEEEPDQHLLPLTRAAAAAAAAAQKSQLALPLSAPTEPWETHAKALVISQFTILTLRGASVYASFDFLPPLLERADPESTLYQVCNAISSAYFANLARSDSIGLRHRKIYGRALQSLATDVSDVEKQRQDSTLVAVWLLCLYELVVGTTSQESQLEPRGWNTHGNAMIGLLRLRGQNQFQTKTGCQLFQIAYPIIQIQAMQMGRTPPPEAVAWLHAMQTSPTAKKMLFLPAFLYSDLACRICSTIRDLIDQGSHEKMLSSINDIIMACRNLESSIDAVIAQSPASHSQPGPLDDLATGQSVQWLMTQHAANYLAACLFQVYQRSVDLLSEALQGNLSPKNHDVLLCLRESSIERLKHLADRILVSLPLLMPVKAASAGKQVPNLTTWGHALKLLWPLRLIASSANVHGSQRVAARQGLLRMGYEAGIMQAVGTYY